MYKNKKLGWRSFSRSKVKILTAAAANFLIWYSTSKSNFKEFNQIN